MHALRTILSRPSTLAALTVSLLINIGNESINVIYGVWLENSFGLQVVALGAASVLIGLAELSGVGLVARLADQLGKVRALCLGIISITVACLLLPILGGSLIPALIGLFLFYLTFEFTFVTLISLFTELAPSARATLMATSITAAAGGRALGALIGPALFDIHILASSAFGAAMAIIALPILLAGGPQRGVSLGNLGIIEDGAIAVADGVILAVGSTGEIQRPPGFRRSPHTLDFYRRSGS